MLYEDAAEKIEELRQLLSDAYLEIDRLEQRLEEAERRAERQEEDVDYWQDAYNDRQCPCGGCSD